MLHNDLNHLRRWPSAFGFHDSLGLNFFPLRGSQNNLNTVMNFKSPLAGVKGLIPLLISFTAKFKREVGYCRSAIPVNRTKGIQVTVGYL